MGSFAELNSLLVEFGVRKGNLLVKGGFSLIILVRFRLSLSYRLNFTNQSVKRDKARSSESPTKIVLFPKPDKGIIEEVITESHPGWVNFQATY